MIIQIMELIAVRAVIIAVMTLVVLGIAIWWADRR